MTTARVLRNRLLALGAVGLVGFALALLPGSLVCSVSGAAGASCADYALLELVSSGAIALVGFGGALLLQVAYVRAERAPA